MKGLKSEPRAHLMLTLEQVAALIEMLNAAQEKRPARVEVTEAGKRQLLRSLNTVLERSQK